MLNVICSVKQYNSKLIKLVCCCTNRIPTKWYLFRCPTRLVDYCLAGLLLSSLNGENILCWHSFTYRIEAAFLSLPSQIGRFFPEITCFRIDQTLAK